MTTGMSQKIAAARLMAANREAYLASALWSLVMLPVAGFHKLAGGSLGVDRWWRCYYDPEKVETMTVEVLSWVLVHEAWHLLRAHADRSRSLGVTAEPFITLVNFSHDMEINDDLNKAGAKWPYPVVTPDSFGFPEDRLSEEYYHRLLQQLDESKKAGPGKCPKCGGDMSKPPQGGGQQGQQPQGGAEQGSQGSKSDQGDQDDSGGSGGAGGQQEGSEGQQAGGQRADGNTDAGSAGGGGTSCPHCGTHFIPIPGAGPARVGSGRCGSAAHGVQQPWERGDPADSGHSDGIGPSEAELMRRQTARKIQEHARDRGTMPEGWLRWAEAVLSPPKIDWRRQLASLVRHSINHAAGMINYSYRKPSRRQSAFPKVILPSMFRPVPIVAVVVDTSGSMSDGMLQQCLSEIKGVLTAAGQREGVSVLSCDADVHAVQKVMDAKQVKLRGGGGTDMRVGIDHAMKLRPRPDIVIVLTDGWTPHPEEKPGGVEIIYGLVDASTRGDCPSWAKVVEIEPEDLREAS